MRAPRFTVGDLVNVKDGYGLDIDREMNPWVVRKVTIEQTKRHGEFAYSYGMASLNHKSTTGFYEEGLEECLQ